MTEIHVSELGEFCMGRRFFWLPKGGGYRKGGGAWYFDIRENEYGWIKPENTVNVDEGGIMVGFGKSSTSTL
jgi:hypothetical protein